MKHLACLGVVVCLVGAATPSNAAVTLYTDIASWSAAVALEAPATYLEDFEGFAVDTPFRTSPVSGSFFTMVQVGESTFRNEIDVPPTIFTDGSGSVYSSMFTNYGLTTVEMSFDSPVFAWGADFINAGDREMLDLDLVSTDGATLATLEVPDGQTFFGFVTSEPMESVDMVVLRSHRDVMDELSPLGEGFGMDNVRGALYPVIPAPGAVVLGTLGAGLVGWLRQRRTL